MIEPEPLNLPGRLRGLADDFTSATSAPDHLQAVRSDGLVVNIEVAAQLREAADALEQRLGLLRDTERRLAETVADLGQLRTELASAATGQALGGPDPIDKHLWDALSADLSKRPLAALIAHYLDRATRKFGRWVTTPEDVHKLVGAALDDEAIALWASITLCAPERT